jgi:hypothetical protein
LITGEVSVVARWPKYRPSNARLGTLKVSDYIGKESVLITGAVSVARWPKFRLLKARNTQSLRDFIGKEQGICPNIQMRFNG